MNGGFPWSHFSYALAKQWPNIQLNGPILCNIFLWIKFYKVLIWLRDRRQISLQIVGNKAEKGESQNGCFKKTKHAKFSQKRTFLTTWYTHVYTHVSGGKKCSFYGKFGVLCFLETPVLRFPLWPYYRRNIGWIWAK